MIGGLRHDLRAIVHRLRCAVERTDDVIHRMFEISGRRFDLLPPRFGLPRTVILALARGGEVFDRAAEYEQRLGHAPNLVVAADRDRDIRVAGGDPAHGAAEQRQAADDAAADIEPGDQAGAGKRNNAEEDQNDPAKLDLRNCPRRKRFGNCPLVLDQSFYSGPENPCLRERGRVNLLGILLALQFVGPFDDDSIVPGQ